MSMWKDKKMQWIILQLSKWLLVNPSEWMRPVLVLFSLMFLYGPLVSNPQLAGSKHHLSAACQLETCAGPSNYEMKNHFISEDQCGNHRKQLTRLSSVSCRTEAIKAGHVCTHILLACFLLLPKIWVRSYFPNPDVIIPESSPKHEPNNHNSDCNDNTKAKLKPRNNIVLTLSTKLIPVYSLSCLL